MLREQHQILLQEPEPVGETATMALQLQTANLCVLENSEDVTSEIWLERLLQPRYLDRGAQVEVLASALLSRLAQAKISSVFENQWPFLSMTASASLMTPVESSPRPRACST